MTAYLTTAGVAALNGGAAFNQDFIHEIRFGTSQSAATLSDGVVTAPTALRTPVSGAAAWDIAGVRSTDGRVFLFRSPASDLARAFTAREIGIFNSAGAMVAYEYGETNPLLVKVANQEGWHNLGIVISGQVTAPITPSFTTAIPIPATESLSGLIELANEAEADAGTDATRAMTPALVKRRIDAGSTVDFQRFTASGTWTKPAGASMVYVELIGGGAAGRSGNETFQRFGGAPGGRVRKLFQASELGATESIVVGDGGRAGGSNATNSRFGMKVIARGARTTYDPGDGRDDRSQTGVTTLTLIQNALSRSLILGYGGGLSGVSMAVNAGPSEEIGVNGGANGTASAPNGVNGGDSTLALGGGGGAGYHSNANSVGGNGGAPGGGGGAGRMRGGNGARGEVRVWAW